MSMASPWCRWTLVVSATALFSCEGSMSASEEGVDPSLYASNTHVPAGFQPNPSFTPSASTVGRVRQGASVEGDIVIVQGDARTVTAQGVGQFGLTEDNQRNILADVLAAVPDRFDTLVIFTGFEDRASATPSYYQPLRNFVSGIGLQLFDNRTTFGLPEAGRLSGYVGMNSPLVFGEGSLAGLDAAQGDYHAAIARELAHRWAFYLRFLDPQSNSSRQLLGVGDQDWSSLAQSSGSILGGNDLVRTDEPADGMGFLRYRNEGRNQAFAPLDLYAMGRVPREEVPVLFYLADAELNGAPVARADDVPVGSVVRGRPVLVNVQQVIDDLGPRQPSAANTNPYYRVAFAFVTPPGAARSTYAPQLELIERVRADLPASWRAWGGGNLCTDIENPCSEPNLSLGEPTIEDDGDGLIGPGEQFGLRLAIENAGIGTAEQVEVSLRALSSTVSVSGGPFIAPPVSQNDTVTLNDAFMVTVTGTTCGGAIALRAEMRTQEGPIFSGEISLSVGTNQLRFDAAEESVDWVVNPDGNDSASEGIWEIGDPELSTAAGVTTQPDNDRTPGDGKLAFMTGPARGDFVAANDLDDGRTTLQSPVYAIGDSVDPTLVFWAWRSVWDFAQNPVVPLRSAPLVVQVSNDGGDSWTELGRFERQTATWTRVEFRIRDALEPTNRTRFRFVVEETEPANVEVGIDDLEILDFLPSCVGTGPGPGPGPGPAPGPGEGGGEGEGGGGCTATAAASASRAPPVWGALFALAGVLFRRRRRARS